MKKDYEKATEMQKATAVDFAQLLDMCASTYPKMRFRFSTSNPQDMHDEVLHVMAKHHNICKYIHLPVQSGSTRILKEMNRQHTREEYMALASCGSLRGTDVHPVLRRRLSTQHSAHRQDSFLSSHSTANNLRRACMFLQALKLPPPVVDPQ